MDLFLDCEWADVLASELVSIALVSGDLQSIFYAERDPLPVDPTPWVHSVVYPLLDRGASAMTDTSMTVAIRQFLASFEVPKIHYDFGPDRSLCQFVIDGFDVLDPPGPAPGNVEWHRCDGLSNAIEAWWSAHPARKLKRHHALMDAMALRAAYLDDLG